LREERGEIGHLDRRFDEPEARVAGEREEVALLHRPRIVIGEGVEADHVGPVGQETLGERRSDEAGDARDKRPHS